MLAALAPQDEDCACGEFAGTCNILSPHPEEPGEAARLDGWPRAPSYFSPSRRRVVARGFGFLPRIWNNRAIGFGRGCSRAGASFGFGTSDRRLGVALMS